MYSFQTGEILRESGKNGKEMYLPDGFSLFYTGDMEQSFRDEWRKTMEKRKPGKSGFKVFTPNPSCMGIRKGQGAAADACKADKRIHEMPSGSDRHR